MEELIKKLKDAGKLETLKSEDELRAAAKELGYSDEDINQMISEYDIPLDDDALEGAAGGMTASMFTRFIDDYNLRHGK